MLHKNLIRTTVKSLSFVLAMFICTTAAAGGAQFRIAFDDVPGSTALETGKVKQGIELLEAAYSNGSVEEGQALATLCGAYLLDRAYDIAESVCHKAAEHYPSKSSLNNFGIYLAIVGDFEGAIRAFNQVQPLHREEYLDFLRNKDIGLIALQNEAVVRDYQSRNMDSENETIRLLAKIEELAP